MTTALVAPNVLAVSSVLESGTTITVFRAVPGDTVPRMQMQIPGGRAVDCGVVEAPERFGSYSTDAEFQAWAERFFAA
jgi:hypothetical protein